MKQNSTTLLLFAVAFAFPTYETLAQPPARKMHIKWVKVNDDEPEPKPHGKYDQTDDGAVLTLPNGNKYVTKVVMDDNGPLAVLTVLPNRQVFSSDTAKGAAGPPFVNEDESLVAVTCHPATQTGDLHIYIKDQNGKYCELPNKENEVVNDLFREAYDNFAGWTLDVRGITGRTLTVWAIIKGGRIEKGAGIYRFEFKLDVTPGGKIALTK